MPPSLGTSLALASTAHGDHLSRGDEHNQAPPEVQGTKIGPDLGPVSLNDLRGGCDVALPVDHGIDLPSGAKRNSIGNRARLICFRVPPEPNGSTASRPWRSCATRSRSEPSGLNKLQHHPVE